MTTDYAEMAQAIAGIVDAKIDQRLGTKRPQRPARLSIPLTHVQKFLANGKRTVTGLATTANIDRHGDIVMPMGGVWKLPVPLLFGHDHLSPIGVIRSAVASSEGVRITADIVEGVAKADEVWALIEADALNAFSIGFMGIKGEPIPSGTRWLEWELLEISVVAVPSNRESRIGKSGVGAVKLITHPDYYREKSAIPGHPGAVRIGRA